MSNGWVDRFSELKQYIERNPSIKISPNVVAIPSNVRPEFYRLFDSVRVEFIKDNFPQLITMASDLSTSYTKVEAEVISYLSLNEISLPTSLNWFLRDPVNGLMRLLFDPLFNLIKGKVSPEQFAEEATQKINDGFKDFFRQGFERWVVLALITLLKADKIYEVPCRELDTSSMEGQLTVGVIEETPPEPIEAKRIVLQRSIAPAFIVPNFIIHSAVLDSYVSMRLEFGEVPIKARQVSSEREWLGAYVINRDPLAKPDLLLFVDENLQNLNLIADLSRVCRPDMVIECVELDWPETEQKRLVLQYDHFQPSLGTFVVSRGPAPESIVKALSPSLQPAESATHTSGADLTTQSDSSVNSEPRREIRFLTSGLEVSNLMAIIEYLKGMLTRASSPDQPGSGAE